MILAQSDKERLVREVESPFLTLADQIQGGTLKKTALRAFKGLYEEKLKTMEEQYEDIFKRLPRATYLFYEHGSGSGSITIPNAWTSWVLLMDGVTAQNHWGQPREPVINREIMKQYVKPEEQETFEKANLLLNKGASVRALLHSWLQPFTMPEQLEFSLPQLGYFLRKIDFRKRRSYGTWNDPPKLSSQRRPKVINVPSDALKGLVSEAAILAQSVKPKVED